MFSIVLICEYGLETLGKKIIFSGTLSSWHFVQETTNLISRKTANLLTNDMIINIIAFDKLVRGYFLTYSHIYIRDHTEYH